MIDAATYRRILVDALTTQAERYRDKGRSYMNTHDRKPHGGFDEAANHYFDLAKRAEEIRDTVQIEDK